MPETWLPVPDWPGYEVSDLGRVRSVERVLSDGRTAGSVVLRATLDGKGYPCVTLRDGKRVWKVRVHRLVKLVHTGPARGRQVRHWNDVPTDNRLANLRYGTQSQNEQDKARNKARRERGEIRGKEGERERKEKEKQIGNRNSSWVSSVVSPVNVLQGGDLG